MRIQQILKSRAHSEIHLSVRVIAVFIVVGNHQENRQTDRFRSRSKLCPAVILGSALRLRNQTFDILIFFIMLDSKMGFNFINRQNHSISPPSFFSRLLVICRCGSQNSCLTQHRQQAIEVLTQRSDRSSLAIRNVGWGMLDQFRFGQSAEERICAFHGRTAIPKRCSEEAN